MKHIILYTTILLYTITARAQDTTYVAYLDTVKVIAQHTWDNPVDRYRFDQMKYYVTTILPYLTEATNTISELAIKEQDPNSSKKERKAFVKKKEQEVRDKFEAEIVALNETQGMYLMKLIARQTGVNVYHIIKEYKGSVAAIKWQAWAKVHGFNLNKKYNPAEEPFLERVMESLGYPLPQYYAEPPIATINSH